MKYENLHNYKTIAFDCDGVLINSNEIKTKSFLNTVLPYGENEAKSFIKYHKENFGVSRYEKFNFFLENIIKKKNKETNI